MLIWPMRMPRTSRMTTLAMRAPEAKGLAAMEKTCGDRRDQVDIVVADEPEH